MQWNSARRLQNITAIFSSDGVEEEIPTPSLAASHRNVLTMNRASHQHTLQQMDGLLHLLSTTLPLQ